MPTPLLEVSNLRVEFPGRRGTLVALDDVSFSMARARSSAWWDRRRKSLTGAAIIGLLHPPGWIAGGEIVSRAAASTTSPTGDARAAGPSDRRHLPGPVAALDPLCGSASSWSKPSRPTCRSRDEARRRALLKETGIPTPAAPHRIRISFRAACASASSSPWRWRRAWAGGRRRADHGARRFGPGADDCADQAPEQGARRRVISSPMTWACSRGRRPGAVLYAGRIAEMGPDEAVAHSPAIPIPRA